MAASDTTQARLRRFVRRWHVSLVAMLGWLLLCSCAPAPPPLVLGLNPWVAHDPFVVARENGLIDPRRVKVVELPSNAEVLRLFRNGLLDAAAMTLDQAIQLADQGTDLRIVAVLDTSAGAHVVMAPPSASLQQLRGQVILAEPSTASALMVRGLLQEAGLGAQDVSVMPLEATLHLEALRSGRALAAVSYEPLATRLRRAGFVPLFDSSRLPDQMMDVLVVRAGHLVSRGADVDVLLRAWSTGLAMLQADPAAAAGWLAPSLGMSAAEYLDALASLRFMRPADSLAYLAGANAPVLREGARLTRVLQQEGVLKGDPSVHDLVDVRPAGRTLQAVD